MIEPGEIYWADLEAGRRPVIVVSQEQLNRGNTVVAVTSTRFAARSALPNCVPFRAGEFGFTSDCVAQGESVGPLETRQLDFAQGVIGKLTEEALRDVIQAVGKVMDADCEPA